MNAAIFLDRDGVIVENRADYIRAWADVAFLPSALAALARIAISEYKIVLITNQSVIGRGLITMETGVGINEEIVARVRQAGGRIDGVYLCPHAPADRCECRKPRPGLILKAARDLGLDLGRSVIIGDAITDLAAGKSAGVGARILVRTGRGILQEQLPHARKSGPFLVFEDLAGAIDHLLGA